MQWPWQRTPEKRQSQPFTDAIVAAIASQAGGDISGNPLSVGAVEMAAGSYARAFAGATVKTDNAMVKKALTPAILGNIARSLIRRGECLYLIEVTGSDVRLQPIGSWDIRGDPDPATWVVRGDIFGASGNRTVFVSYSQIVHCMYSFDSARPWLGLPPLAWGSLTGTLAAALESRLGQEAGAAVGHILPIPQSPDDADVDADAAVPGVLAGLKSDLAAAKGSTVILETTSAGWGEGKSASPQSDWKSQRFGASPPDVLAVLNSAVGQSVLGVCGVPVSLFVDATGTGAKESWRRFILGSCMSLAALVQTELSAKLEAEIELSFEGNWAHDLVGRGQAFKAFVAGGMAVERAAALSGLLGMEEE